MKNCEEVILVACVSKKLNYPAEAQDIYISTLFKKIRKYIDLNPKAWCILSAKHGLLPTDTVIEPYNKTLNTMSVADRKNWAHAVTTDINTKLPNLQKVTFFAGVKYREFLEPNLIERKVEINVPLYGMRIGQQLQWLSQRT